jgi:RNA polymerase sigma factor (sigma-70 family)
MLQDKPDTLGETALWQRFRAGDEAAFTYLISKNFQLLYRYGLKYSPEEAFIKDCIQELFIDLWERRQSLSEVITIKAYLMASLRRRLHRESLSKKRQTSELTDIEQVPFDVEFSVEDSLIRQETTRELAHGIKAQLEQLPKRQKEVVYLRFFEDMSREEIAKVMDINPQSVSNLLQAAFKYIKSNWKVDFFIFFILKEIVGNQLFTESIFR